MARHEIVLLALATWLCIGVAIAYQLLPKPPRGYAEHTTRIPRSSLDLPVNAVRDLIVTNLGYKPEVAPTLLTWEVIAQSDDEVVVLARTANTPGY